LRPNQEITMNKPCRLSAIFLMTATALPASAQSGWLGKWKETSGESRNAIEFSEFDGQVLMTGSIAISVGNSIYNYPRTLATALVFSKDGETLQFKNKQGATYLLCEKQSPSRLRCTSTDTSGQAVYERS